MVSAAFCCSARLGDAGDGTHPQCHPSTTCFAAGLSRCLLYAAAICLLSQLECCSGKKHAVVLQLKEQVWRSNQNVRPCVFLSFVAAHGVLVPAVSVDHALQEQYNPATRLGYFSEVPREIRRPFSLECGLAGVKAFYRQVFSCVPQQIPDVSPTRQYCWLPFMLDDPWIALDKLEHLVFCAFIVVATYVVCLRLITSNRAVSLSAAVLLSLLAAGAKELGDYLHVRS